MTLQEIVYKGKPDVYKRQEINGEKTDLFVLKNKNKMEVCITNYGGRIVSVMVPDKDGIMRWRSEIQNQRRCAVVLQKAAQKNGFTRF